ncbi:hypothetical protein KL86DYS1_20324 [uncultured Dysgonomonas sp.]|uniref:Uncharacterized protein n=1 Tax=uncultured Dysgonomonas sp. TaxID=206096 RepID=A0A212JNB8_9BACT|nr:hypothetical protein KL86DYS1_20324 [uncultured Dysgonomonas sp.]
MYVPLFKGCYLKTDVPPNESRYLEIYVFPWVRLYEKTIVSFKN